MWAASSIKDLLDHQKIIDVLKKLKQVYLNLPKDYLNTHENSYLRL